MVLVLAKCCETKLLGEMLVFDSYLATRIYCRGWLSKVVAWLISLKIGEPFRGP